MIIIIIIIISVVVAAAAAVNERTCLQEHSGEYAFVPQTSTVSPRTISSLTKLWQSFCTNQSTHDYTHTTTFATTTITTTTTAAAATVRPTTIRLSTNYSCRDKVDVPPPARIAIRLLSWDSEPLFRFSTDYYYRFSFPICFIVL